MRAKVFFDVRWIVVDRCKLEEDRLLVLEFLGLLLVIVAAAWLLSIGAEKLAEKYGSNFAGSILLALVTTLPEYLFVFWACLKGQYSVAVGSAVGACTLLVTLGYGSVILVATSKLSKNPVDMVQLSKHTQIDAIHLLVTALAALFLAWEGDGLDLKDGLILTALFITYVVQHSIVASKIARTETHTVSAAEIKRALFMLLAGGIIIVFASERFVESVIGIAEWIGISPFAVAIVLSPIASELPEKITAYLTIIRDGKLAEISVCNFMGSKVNHNSLLLALLPFIAAAKGDGSVQIINIPFITMTALTLVASLSLARRRLTRAQGWVFLLLYLVTIWAAYEVR